MAPRRDNETMHSISSNWQALCKRVTVERDPVRLLAVFLWIDRLSAQKGEKHIRRREQVMQPQSYLEFCPHCSAIIELEKQLLTNLERCPWCEGPLIE